MGNEAPIVAVGNTVGENEEARIFAFDATAGGFVPLELDQNGALQVSVPSGSDLPTNLTEVAGQQQSAVDIAARIDGLTFDGDGLLIDSDGPLDVSAATVTVTDDGNLDIASLPEPLDVSDAEVDVDLNSQTLGAVTVTDDGSLAIAAYNGGTLPTEQQSPVGVEDAGGTQVDPSRSTDFPNQQVVGSDLTASQTTIGPVTVARSEALVIAVNETSGGTLDVSIDWVDGSGNVFQTETATDLGLDNVTEDWARVVRKGPQATITLTNDAGATSTNAHADTHR